MTVPHSFQRNSEIPRILILHCSHLAESEIQSGPGYKYTRPLRIIADLIEDGTIEKTFIRQAVRQAADRGLITRQQIEEAPTLSEQTRNFIEGAVSQVTR